MQKLLEMISFVLMSEIYAMRLHLLESVVTDIGMFGDISIMDASAYEKPNAIIKSA